MDRLEADGVELSFGTRKILSNIYIKAETGSITGLLAKNGAGKTCLMNIIYGGLAANSRSVRVNNVSVLEIYKRPKLLTYLPQFNFIPPALTLQRVFKDFDLPFDDFKELFPVFKGRPHEKFSKLSGGQRRLTEVYLLIKSKTKFTLLDEPFSHLMPLHLEKIAELITQEKEHKGFIITDHLYTNVTTISDHIYVLKDGKTHQTKNDQEIEALGYANFYE